MIVPVVKGRTTASSMCLVVIRSMGRAEETGEAPALRREYDRPSPTRRFDSAGQISHFARPTFPSLSFPCPPFHDPNPLVWTLGVSTKTYSSGRGQEQDLLFSRHLKEVNMETPRKCIKTNAGLYFLPFND